nr:hypothetical protein [Tanacetum cinerariifolium]
METGLLRNPSETTALKLMKKIVDIYFAQPCLACSRVFVGNTYGDHVVSCAGIIGIKHCYNVVRDTLVDICYRYGISTGKEVDIGLDVGRDKSELEADAVTLLKRIRKFFMAQDIGARAAIRILNRISFAIAREVGAQIVSRLSSNLL